MNYYLSPEGIRDTKTDRLTLAEQHRRMREAVELAVSFLAAEQEPELCVNLALDVLVRVLEDA